ncbi:MAG: DUF4398 domain-containing protein [Nannocystaceae bacterium]|nr:DUF4398 domain-containing protein [bacterium]
MNYLRLSPLVAIIATGCASQQLPQQQMLDTNAALDSAEEIDAGQTPSVDLHIKFAEDQLKIAKSLIEDGKEEEAERMLDRAQADAELALAKARTERSRNAATEAWTEVNELQNR